MCILRILYVMPCINAWGLQQQTEGSGQLHASAALPSGERALAPIERTMGRTQNQSECFVENKTLLF